MYTSFSGDCKLILYAGDSAMQMPIKSQKSSEVMESYSNVLVNNKFFFYIWARQSVFLLSLRENFKNIPNFNVKCKGHVIKSQDSVRYL